MKLPNGNLATIRIEKLTEYALNPEHPVGKHKARLFARLLGITVQNPEPLRAALLDAAANLEPVPGKSDAYGQRYTIDFPMNGVSGEVAIRSVWIVREGESPDLVTCFIL